MARTKALRSDEVRGGTVTVPMNAIEKKLVQREATKLGMTMSAYIRYKLFYEKEEK